MDASQFLTLLESVGVSAALLGVFVWWSWVREQRLANRVTSLETFIQNQLISIVEKAVHSQDTLAEQIRNLTEELTANTIQLQKDAFERGKK